MNNDKNDKNMNIQTNFDFYLHLIIGWTEQNVFIASDLN